jgi:putative MATE family efflux protein
MCQSSLSCNGSVALLRKRVIKLAWPAILEMVLHTTVWMFDTAMVGRLSPEALSAVGFGGQLAFSFTYVFTAIGIGTSTMVARYIGARQQQKADSVLGQSLMLSILISVSLACLYISYGKTFFSIVMKDPLVIRLGSEYIKIVSLGLIFMIPTQVMNSALRGAGNTRLPMLSAMVTNSLNIIGDYALIFGKFGLPRLEVNGAALATTIAQIIGALITIIYITKMNSEVKLFRKNFIKLDIAVIRQILKMSVPAALEELNHNGSRLLSSFWIANLGTLPFAAHGVAVSAESMSFMPGYGFSVAASSLVGQNLGAQKKKLAELSAKESVKYAILLMGFFGVIFYIMPNWIIQFFTDIPDVKNLASKCIMIAAFEQPFLAISMTLAGALRGAGDTKGTFLISFMSTWGVRIPLIFVVINLFNKGLTAVWVVTVIQFVIEAMLMGFRFLKGHWKEISLD